MNTKVYPRTNDFQTIYLNTVIKNPAIIVGDYTIYNDLPVGGINLVHT